jgi:hypothetical protein
MFESNGFDESDETKAKKKRETEIPNQHLTFVENEIFLSIKYNNDVKLLDLGLNNNTDIDFKIEVGKD